MAKALILYVDAGFGHRKVAEAVYQELMSRNQPNLEVEIFDALTKTNPIFQKSYPRSYFEMVVRAPWLWGFLFSLSNSASVYSLIYPLRTLWNWFQSIGLRKYIKNGNYDFIIFTHFFPAEVCATEKKKGNIHSTLITIVTDVIPHRVWENKGTDTYWVMAKESLDMLIKFGVPSEKIKVKGIPINAQFLKPQDREQLLKKLDLQTNKATILFTSGSFGIGPTEEALKSFDDLKDKIQVIAVCGNNKLLLERLNHLKFNFPVRTFGFVSNMHELMSVSDIMVAKPGGATTCESLVKNLPMIITSAIPGQEQENAKWLTEHGAAFEIKETSDIEKFIKQILNDPQILERLKKSTSQLAKPYAAQDLSNFIIEKIK